ncbi:hypothetical protein TRIP_B350125 [uncultured Desulfatiglans sp.]|nr:hypothetical protein TRIP_B350125 [uncultured Desulfatiglans sp.]
MKLQYLGDSKDSFKWDYHDYLTSALGFNTLNILLMMTSDENSNEGKTKSDWFPSRPQIIDFCKDLRSKRGIDYIRSMPSLTGASYKVRLHNLDRIITRANRESYFLGLNSNENQVVFLDPDNGFEPETRYNEKHVSYSEILSILRQISSESLISVFQHFRRIKFDQDFKRIRQRLNELNTTVHAVAIYWHQLMFVLISRSEKIIQKVNSINMAYASNYPVNWIE